MLVVWKNLISLLLKNKSISRVYRIIFSWLKMSLLFDNDRQHYFVYINTIWENHTICDCMYKFLCFLECIYFRCLKDDLSNGIDQKKKCYYIFKHSKADCFPKFLYLLILFWLLLVLINFFYTTKYVANIFVSLDNTKESRKNKTLKSFLRRIWVEMINA